MIECSYLNREINIHVATGRIDHCCKMATWPIGNKPIEQNPMSLEIKSSMAAGIWHSACNSCKLDEQKGLISYRKANVDQSEKLNVIVQLPSYCQASCFYCSESLSSTIASYGKWVNLAGKVEPVSMPPLKPKVSISAIENYIASLDPTKDIQLGFVGGEPFITEAFFDYIDPMIDAALRVNPNREVLIGAATNSHNKIEYTKLFYDIINQTKSKYPNSRIITDVAVSIENVGKQAEWSRNLVWQDFLTVLQVHLDNADFCHFKPCWNFTCGDKKGLVRYLKFLTGIKGTSQGHMQFNYVNQKHLRPQVLGKKSCKQIIELQTWDLHQNLQYGFKKYQRWLSNTDNNLKGLAPQTARHIYNVDKIRGTNFVDAFPNLETWYKENLNAL